MESHSTILDRRFMLTYERLISTYGHIMIKKEVCTEVKKSSRVLDHAREKGEFPINLDEGERKNKKTTWATIDIAWYICHGVKKSL